MNIATQKTLKSKEKDILMQQQQLWKTTESHRVKPLLRGWSHAIAAIGATILTIALCWQSREDGARFLSMLIFGLSMIEMYTMSAIYHIGNWRPERKRRLRAIDHANIFVLIAGTYTPLCFNLLAGWVRIALLVTIWALAALGVGLTIVPLTLRLPRWINAVLYVLMGWVALLALPAFLQVVPWQCIATLILGGLLYTIGAIVYAARWPNPFPRVL